MPALSSNIHLPQASCADPAARLQVLFRLLFKCEKTKSWGNLLAPAAWPVLLQVLRRLLFESGYNEIKENTERRYHAFRRDRAGSPIRVSTHRQDWCPPHLDGQHSRAREHGIKPDEDVSRPFLVLFVPCPWV